MKLLQLGVANGPARPVLARPVCGPSKNGLARQIETGQ